MKCSANFEQQCLPDNQATSSCVFVGLQRAPFQMFPRQRLWAQDRDYYLEVFPDGVLTIFNASSYPTWSVGNKSASIKDAVLKFDTDGRLAIVSQSTVLWSSALSVSPPILTLELVKGSLIRSNAADFSFKIGSDELIQNIRPSLISVIDPGADFGICAADNAHVVSTGSLISITTQLFANALYQWKDHGPCDGTSTCCSYWPHSIYSAFFGLTIGYSPTSEALVSPPPDCQGAGICDGKQTLRLVMDVSIITDVQLTTLLRRLNSLHDYWQQAPWYMSCFQRCGTIDQRTSDLYSPDSLISFPIIEIVRRIFRLWPVDDPSILRVGNIYGQPLSNQRSDPLGGLENLQAYVFFDRSLLAQVPFWLSAEQYHVFCISPSYETTHFAFNAKDLLFGKLIGRIPNGVLLHFIANYFQFRTYPYLRAVGTEHEIQGFILPGNTNYIQEGYPNLDPLIYSWLKYYSPTFINVSTDDRFNSFGRPPLIGGSGGIPKQVRDYNMNFGFGLEFCNTFADRGRSIAQSLCIDAFAQIEVLSTVEGDAELATLVANYNLHPESDTCRRLYAQTPDKVDFVNKYVGAVCRKEGEVFANAECREACRKNYTDDCRMLDSLFTNNGNCSCFLSGESFGNILGASELQKIYGVNSVCYPDCSNHVGEYKGGSYQIKPCDSKICIIKNATDIQLGSMKGTISLDQVGCCDAEACKHLVQPPAKSAKTWVIVLSILGAIGLLVGIVFAVLKLLQRSRAS